MMPIDTPPDLPVQPAPTYEEVDQGHGCNYAGASIFTGEPVWIPRLKCPGCEYVVDPSDPTDCAIYHESCPAYGTNPDVDFARNACGLPPLSKE